MFYFIYKKLSKLYRRHNDIKTIKSITQFEKLFKIWKLLYNIEELSLPNIKENNNKLITFYIGLNKKNNNIDINIEDLISKKESEIIINISFAISPILGVNKLVEDFYFFKIFDKNNNYFKLKYNDIFNKNNNNNIEPFSKVNNIIIKLKQFEYTIYVNNIKLPSVKESFNFDSISRIKLLNYFYGEISYIFIQKQYLSDTNKNIIIEIKRDNNSEIKCNFLYENLNNKKNPKSKFNYSGTIFSNYSYYNVNKIMIKGKKDLNEIEYFGGFDCFIPLFRLIKYIITNLTDKINFENNNEKENYIKKSLLWVKDILIIIFKLICLKENNFKNFINIIIPLIASLSEIYYTINNLISSEKIQNNFK